MTESEATASAAGTAALEIYPWHDAVWTAIAQCLDRLPHALLLRGQRGLGKQAFALRLARALLCSQTGADACGSCHGCLLLAAGTHPDLALIHPLEDSKVIAVDQIRALGDFLSLRPHTAAHKVVIVSPAEAMNLNAANSLLKVLEEPPLGCIIMLVTSHGARLPATIRSRCVEIPFKPPARNMALTWLGTRPQTEDQPASLLEYAGGAPLLAVALAQSGFLANRAQLLRDIQALSQGQEDPLSCAARWKTVGAEICLAWMHTHISGLIKIGMTASSGVPEAVALDAATKNKYSISYNKLYNMLDVISESRRLLSGPLDALLVLEDILIRWTRISRERLN